MKRTRARVPEDSRPHPSSLSPQPSSFSPHPLTEGEDFYLEGATLVFTAQYHLRRGYCCGSGCRHCPFEDERATEHERDAIEESLD